MSKIRIVSEDSCALTGRVELEDGTLLENITAMRVVFEPGKPVKAYLEVVVEEMDVIAELEHLTVKSIDYFRMEHDALPES